MINYDPMGQLKSLPEELFGDLGKEQTFELLDKAIKPRK